MTARMRVRWIWTVVVVCSALVVAGAARGVQQPYVAVLGCSNSSLIEQAYRYVSVRDITYNAAQGGYTLKTWATETAWSTSSSGQQTNPPFNLAEKFVRAYAPHFRVSIWLLRLGWFEPDGRLSLFKDGQLKKPWFKTLASKDGVGTQDLAFWTDARKYGYRCAVDTRVKVGHYDSATETVW